MTNVDRLLSPAKIDLRCSGRKVANGPPPVDLDITPEQTEISIFSFAWAQFTVSNEGRQPKIDVFFRIEVVVKVTNTQLTAPSAY